MPTINFFTQTKKNPATIYVRLRDGALTDCKAKTPYVINPLNWVNGKKGQGIAKHALRDAEMKSLQNKLEALRASLFAFYNQRDLATNINSQWLKECINPSQKTELSERLTDYFEFYRTHKRSEIRESTFSKLAGVMNLIKRYEEKKSAPILIRNVGIEFKLDFESFCKAEGYSPNTIARLFRFIKTVCYHAGKNGIQTNKNLSELKSKMVPVDKVYLSFDEIELIYNTPLKQPYLDNARDWLIISCETGQRVSDFMGFTASMLRFQEGHTFIDFKQVKTNKLVSVPLSSRVKEILAKRNGDFPKRISEQRYNDYIKEVARIAGLTQKVEGGKINKETNRKERGCFEKCDLVTSHIGRRSFATNNYGKIPTSVLRLITGHSTEEQFLEYVGKTQSESALIAAQYFI